jgi:hypothetical protein
VPFFFLRSMKSIEWLITVSFVYLCHAHVMIVVIFDRRAASSYASKKNRRRKRNRDS